MLHQLSNLHHQVGRKLQTLVFAEAIVMHVTSGRDVMYVMLQHIATFCILSLLIGSSDKS
jgi:hypothetical protein